MQEFKTSPAKRAAAAKQRAKRRKDPEARKQDAAYFKEYRRTNRERIAKKDKAYAQANAVVIRLKRLGLDPALKSYVEGHNGRCDICGGPGDGRWHRLTIDHCHKTQVFRGLLCSKCNRGLGFFKDSPELLAKAVEYLGRVFRPV